MSFWIVSFLVTGTVFLDCVCVPNTFDLFWLYCCRLEATKPKQLFFARKFEPVVHQEIINRVDDWLELPVGEEEERHHYWQNVFHHLGENFLKNEDKLSVPRMFFDFWLFFADRFPATPADFLLLMESLCKLFLATDPATSALQFAKTLEVTVHKYKDDLDSILVYFQAKPRGEAAEAVELEIAVRHAEPSDLGMQVLSIPQIVARFFFVPLNFIGNPS